MVSAHFLPCRFLFRLKSLTKLRCHNVIIFMFLLANVCINIHVAFASVRQLCRYNLLTSLPWKCKEKSWFSACPFGCNFHSVGQSVLCQILSFVYVFPLAFLIFLLCVCRVVADVRKLMSVKPFTPIYIYDSKKHLFN